MSNENKLPYHYTFLVYSVNQSNNEYYDLKWSTRAIDKNKKTQTKYYGYKFYYDDVKIKTLYQMKKNIHLPLFFHMIVSYS